MNKKLLITGIFLSRILGMASSEEAFASETNCPTLLKEIAQLEKDLLQKNKLLAERKQELEKLPSESSSKKMILTADTFISAAESETTQNWLEVKRKEKMQKCAKP